MTQATNSALAQLDNAIALFDSIIQQAKSKGYNGIPDDELNKFVASGMAAIYRIAGNKHPYYSETQKKLDRFIPQGYEYRVPIVGGSIKALREDVANGYLVRIEELAHAEIFSDFLDMADHFLKTGYKDPAAVLIGGVLEEHLRKLCVKNGVAITTTTAKGTQPKRADLMNADLCKASIYSSVDQSLVASFLTIRNKAAHGEYSEYDADQVKTF